MLKSFLYLTALLTTGSSFLTCYDGEDLVSCPSRNTACFHDNHDTHQFYGCGTCLEKGVDNQNGNHGNRAGYHGRLGGNHDNQGGSHGDVAGMLTEDDKGEDRDVISVGICSMCYTSNCNV